MQAKDHLQSAASEAISTACRGMGRLAGRLQDMTSRRIKAAHKPEPTAEKCHRPDSFKRACVRMQTCTHAWYNGYELRNRKMFAQFLEDARIIEATLHYNVSESTEV